MRRQDGVVSRGFKTAPKSALTSQRILWPGHHYRDAGGHDDRADRAFDAPMTSILYPDLQNWNSERCATRNFLGQFAFEWLGERLQVAMDCLANPPIGLPGRADDD